MIVNPGGLEWARWLKDHHAAVTAGYRLARDYYDGRHSLFVPPKARHWLERHYNFRGNLCDVVVDALAERLHVHGFATGNPDLDRVVWGWWTTSRMDAVSSAVHKGSTKLGDQYLLIDYARSAPRFTRHGVDGLFPRYSNGDIEYAVKVWDEAGARRYNVYYADRVERYVSSPTGRGLLGVIGGQPGWSVPTPVPDAGVTPWLDRSGAPLGVPVVHFKNNAQDDEAYGRPEHAQIIPLQDALNKSLVDLLLVMDTMGFPQRWATGPTPLGHEWSSAPGRVWKSDDPDAKFGQFDAADPAGILDSLMLLVNLAAGRSRTPQHLFHISGEYPTGESLKTAELGFVHKVENRALFHGASWAQAVEYALKLEATFGSALTSSPAGPVATLWRPWEPANPQVEAQAVATIAPFLPQREVWRRLGYSPADIDRLTAEWEAEQAAKATAGEAAMRAFVGGN